MRGTSVADYAYASVYNVSHATGYYYTSRIMVTLPSEAATSPDLIRGLLQVR